MFHIAGNPWTAPDGLDTLYPQLHLNIDDETPYVLHNGSLHVKTEASRSSLLFWVVTVPSYHPLQEEHSLLTGS